MSDNRQPIEACHIAFTQEAVALARKHGITNLVIEFGKPLASHHYQKTRASWVAGRHGSSGQIEIRGEAIACIEEGLTDGE